MDEVVKNMFTFTFQLFREKRLILLVLLHTYKHSHGKVKNDETKNRRKCHLYYSLENRKFIKMTAFQPEFTRS